MKRSLLKKQETLSGKTLMKEYFNFQNTCPLHLASIPAKQAKFCLSVFKTLQEKIPQLCDALQNTTFLLAVSGGLDSLAMLALFAACQKHFGYRLQIAHYNHGIREESFAEEKLMEIICRRLRLPLTVERGDTPKFAENRKIGLEEAGRILRYDFFEKQQEKNKNTILCTAHHANDLCEDVLMRLLRGTVWPRLGGMPYYDEKRRLLRPLLYVPKQRLADFLLPLDFPVANDKTNADERFLRNRIRKTVIPLLEKENPQFYQNIIKLNQNAHYDSMHFQQQVQEIFSYCEETEQGFLLPLFTIQDKDKTIRMHTYHALLHKMGQGHAINASFENLDHAVMRNQGKTVFKFSRSVRMQILHNVLYCFVKPNV
jgi:tRNA(Ile)-lysidine synthase